MHYETPDGRKLLDAMSGLWCCNAGHCREPIVEAIRRQTGPSTTPRLPDGHAPAFRLASHLAKLAPGDLNHVFFCNSGSEAVDTALKIALAYHKLAGQSTRTRFIARAGLSRACLGGTPLGGIPQNRNLFEPLLEVDPCPRPIPASARPTRGASPRAAATCRRSLLLRRARRCRLIAAVIVEPMLARPACSQARKAIFSACARSPARTASC